MDMHEQKPFAMPTAIIGGLRIAAADRATVATNMIRMASRPRRGRPFYCTSANGEVVARAFADKAIAALFREADQIVADGQPLVIASQWLCKTPLPERVATTDLFHDVARLAQEHGQSFYLLGSTASECERAAAAARATYPRLNIIGHCHGYLSGRALEDKLREIDRLGPDILWLGLGVPREQAFVREFSALLPNVGLIKTSGGLFNHLSGKNRRAPRWMQKAGLEWLWRMLLEPRRLAWRYLKTNPLALYAILRHSQ